MSGIGPVGGRGITRWVRIAWACSASTVAAAVPVASADRSMRLVVRVIPARSVRQGGGLGEGRGSAGAGGHRPQSR
jgi:hypothetical protein